MKYFEIKKQKKREKPEAKKNWRALS